jgi:BolA protein
MGPIEKRLRHKLEAAFSPTHFELENESHTHSVPKNSETHFKLVLVSHAFEGLSRVARQRKVYDVLKEELAPGGVHALTQRVLTPNEWSPEAVAGFESPACHSQANAESKKEKN